jgi:hypothetical protein|tara:strand:+ start:730 stop:1107 length:378 start_codon:yes stop_codon:yes gene_type:complete
MSINSTINKELIRIEKILSKSGLYKEFSYTDKAYSETTYNPITGDHDSTSASTDYTFNAVTLDQKGGSLEESSYSILMDIIVMAANVTFDMRPGLEFTLGTQVWNVSTYKLNPGNSAYEITLGRR